MISAPTERAWLLALLIFSTGMVSACRDSGEDRDAGLAEVSDVASDGRLRQVDWVDMRSEDQANPHSDAADCAFPSDLADGGSGDVDLDAGALDGGDVPADLHVDAPDAGTGGTCNNGFVPALVTPVEEGRFQVACPGYDLEVEIVAEGILRTCYRGAEPQLSLTHARVLEGPIPAYSAGGSDSAWLLCTDEFSLTLTLPECRLEVTDAEGQILLSDGDGGGYQEAAEVLGPEEALVRKVVRETPADELFYGFGEKTGPLNKRGRVLHFWGSDTPGYPVDMDPLYQSIPFFMGLRDGRGYGLFVDNTWRMEFDMAATDPDHYVLRAGGGAVDQYLIAGPELTEVLRRYTLLTGRMPLPPRWTLGYHQARWSYYPDSKVKEICEGFRERDIPADAIWLDIDYMDGFRSFTWDPVGFSDPAGLVAELAAIDFKTVVIIDPGLKSDPGWDVYDAGLAGGHFLLGPDGKPFVGEVWPGASVFPDFTRTATRDWWGSLFPRVTDMGVRGVWLDMNEPANFLAEHNHTVPGTVMADNDGEPLSMDGVHNSYALAEAKASYAGLLAAEPTRRPFLLTRAGYAGIQRYAAVWTGDAASTMESLEMTVSMLLGLGLSGIPFVGSDVGGWTGDPGAELFARWIQVGSFSPFFRTHVATGTPDQEPWSFTMEVEEISRLVIGYRYRLLPYLYSLFYEAGQNGMPIWRAMPLAFQDDPNTYALSTQGMLGPWLLYAPVVTDNATERTLYLPAGRWLEWHSGRLYEGPGFVTVGLTLQALPVFVRAGAIVPTAPLMMASDAAPIDPLTLELVPAAEKTTFLLYEDDGDSLAYQEGACRRVEYGLTGSASGATLVVGPAEGTWEPPARSLRLRVRPVDGAVQAVLREGEALPEAATWEAFAAAESGFYHDVNDRSLWVVTADGDDFVVELQYDVEIVALSPEVLVPVRVTVPEGTPADATIHIATSAAGWAQQPLAWSAEENVAQGLVPVPRGEWFEYKYTRGDWPTVEKWGGCLEADNRYAFGRATPVKEDQVQMWADDPGCQ